MGSHHSASFTVYGDNAEQIDDAARSACEAYFGPDVEFAMSIHTSVRIRTGAGKVLGYEADVSAVVEDDQP